jgi:hypothetical protein
MYSYPHTIRSDSKSEKYGNEYGFTTIHPYPLHFHPYWPPKGKAEIKPLQVMSPNDFRATLADPTKEPKTKS